MINGQFTLQGFRYAIADAEAEKNVDGKPTGEKCAIKILTIKDAHSSLHLNFVFSPEELEAFIATIDGRTIIRPPVDEPFFTRNGRIRP